MGRGRGTGAGAVPGLKDRFDVAGADFASAHRHQRPDDVAHHEAQKPVGADVIDHVSPTGSLDRGGGLSSAARGSSKSFGSPSGLEESSRFGDPVEGPQRRGSASESPLGQATKKKRKLPEGLSIASFTFEEERFEDGVCNVFFFPRGTSTGGSIEVLSESGRSFVIEIEAVTGSVKIREPDDYESYY